MSAFVDYIREIRKNLDKGDATEHTHRPALEALLEACGKDIDATNEPRRIACGAPDFNISRKGVPLGHVETKDVGINLDEMERGKGPNGDQFKRYSTLPNWILTDYLEFRWYAAGEKRLTVHVADLDGKGKLKPAADGEERLTELLTAFYAQPALTVGTARELAGRMAGMTCMIRDLILAALRQEEEKAEQVNSRVARETMPGYGSQTNWLHEWMQAFRDTLIPDLDEHQFADMFAQTLAYGLFAARVHEPNKPFSRESVAVNLPRTNPFLRELFEQIAGVKMPDTIAWAVDDMVELLKHADMLEILRDFGKCKGREDPVVHFYETFLAAYDPAMREVRGVFYTPEPAVSYIVRSIDWLLKTRLGRAKGLADENTLVLDTATGTATFLYFVIDLIHQGFRKQLGAWDGYVGRHLLPRIFGFELLMAPYAVAHLKISMLLEQSGYTFGSDQRLGIYLTNTLEEAAKKSELLLGQFVSREANAAAEIKRDRPIMVVLGNPPYSGHSANKGEWITGLVRDYKKNCPELHKPGQAKWLQDDYVKFIRFAEWRINQTGEGVLGYITNHGYLDNPTFRGMRQHLMQTFDEIYVLDLHGNSKKKEKAPDGGKDENVFDITVGVSILLAVKKETEPSAQPSVGQPSRLPQQEGKQDACPTLKVEANAGQPSRLPQQEGKQDACPTFFDPRAPLEIKRNHLPHWCQRGVIYFVTFRLADSLPQSKLRQLELERQEWLHRHPEPRSPEDETEYHRLFSERVQDWLDAGDGSCCLRDPVCARLVADALRFFDGDRYTLDEWVVMPNHVHALVTPLNDNELSKILHSWKSFTAKEINRKLGRTGQLWQHETYDHIVRSERQLYFIRQYIRDNPVRANVGQPSRLPQQEGKQDACPTLAGGANVGQPSRLPQQEGKQDACPTLAGGANVGQPSRLPQQEGKQDACPTLKIARVFHADLWGRRAIHEGDQLAGGKYRWLWQNSAETTTWNEVVASAPGYSFIPQDERRKQEYDQGWSVPAIFSENGDPAPGIVTTHDEFAIAFTREEMTAHVEALLATQTEEAARGLFRLCSQSQWNYADAKKELLRGQWRNELTPILYRPFDVRWTAFNRHIAVHRRERVMRHMVHGDNIALIATRQTRDEWHVFTTCCLMGHKAMAAFDINTLFPLYLCPAPDELDAKSGRRPNFSPAFLKALAEKLKAPQEGPHGLPKGMTPEDIFHYAYAVFHSPAYRTRYAEFLKIDFPRLPLTGNRDLFFSLAALGGELVGLHTMESPKLNDLITEFPEKGTDAVEKVTFTVDAASRRVGSGGDAASKKETRRDALVYKETRRDASSTKETRRDASSTLGRVWINPAQYFGGVPAAVWSFHIGGYQVCEKWLKDRKGRTLTYEDIQHYQRIVVALNETIRLMAGIDQSIETQGGWPGAFSGEQEIGGGVSEK